MKFSAEVKDLPEHHVIAARHLGPYPEIPEAIERLFAWAGPKGHVNFPQTQLLAVYHDDPNDVPAAELRSDACITVSKATHAEDDTHGIHSFSIPGGRFAVAHVEIDQTQYLEAWQKLEAWMQQHNVKAAVAPERLCYEWYLNDPETHPEKKHIVDICTPIEADQPDA